MIRLLYLPPKYYHNNDSLNKSILLGRELLKCYGSDLTHEQEDIIFSAITDSIYKDYNTKILSAEEDRDYKYILSQVDKICVNYQT